MATNEYKVICCSGPEKSEQCKSGEKIKLRPRERVRFGRVDSQFRREQTELLLLDEPYFIMENIVLKKSFCVYSILIYSEWGTCMCDCLERIPYHLRTDKVIYSEPQAPKTKIPYGSEVRSCFIGDSSEGAMPADECRGYFGSQPEEQHSPKPPQLKCQLTGDQKVEIPSKCCIYGIGTMVPFTYLIEPGICILSYFFFRDGIRLTPEGGGDWTRFDLMSDVPDSDEDDLQTGAGSAVKGRQEAVADDEASDDDDSEEPCRCNYPFCKACKYAETSTESSGAILIEKSISFDDEILEAVDSEMWLNPVPHRKVLQFASIEQREKYKAESLGKMKDNAVTLPRSEWVNHLGDFDHYVTILMGESSPESSSDYDDSEVKAEKGRMRKQKKKKRLMYSVEDIKGVPLYNTKYVRYYMEFMEDLKKRAAITPTHYWPRFMKIFTGYGTAADEEKDPEWLGLLLMAPKECFREISSSSSCESLPVMSDPGSTTTSLSPTECSPTACAMDSTEHLERAGVCVTERPDKGFPTEEADGEEEETVNVQDEEPIVRPVSKSIIAFQSEDPNSQDGMKTATDQRRSSARKPSSAVRSRSSLFRQNLEVRTSKSAATVFRQGSFMQSHDKLEGLASEMLRSFSRKQSTRLLNFQEQLGVMDEITVIQQELLPTSLGVKLREFGEGHPGETDHPHPEFEMMKRNVIYLRIGIERQQLNVKYLACSVIVRGKLYKMNYECLCGETCYCDPKKLVEKYVGMLISEIYGLEDSEEEEEETEDVIETDDVEKRSTTEDLAGASSGRRMKGTKTEENVGAGGQGTSPVAPGRTRVEEPCFILDPDVNVDVRDRAIYPKGLYDREDVEKVKAAAPDGIVAYKDFYHPGDLKGLSKSRKEVEKAKKQEKENKNQLDPSSSLLDPKGQDSDDEATGSSHDQDTESHSITESSGPQGSSSSSHPLCQCCDCVTRYEESGKIIRRCDKKTCFCCACKAKIVKVAKKLYTRKKGARFLYILLKKIRTAINKPSKDTREQSLQDIVNELRIEAARFSRKKWPFYFKEIMISAGLESPSESTSVSEEEKSQDQRKKRSKKPWRYREEPKYSKKFTAADIQQREWENLKAKSFEEEKPIANYLMPQRAVLKIEDMSRWQNSEAYYEYLGFILAMDEVIKGHSCKEKFPHSPNVEALLAILNRLSDWIDEIPPIQQPQRFGNKAFRTWLERLTKEGPTLLVELMPATFHGGLGEAQAYLLEGFGNCTRIDYGTGHEMAFVMFLCCLFKIGVFTKDDQLPVVLTIFTKYLDVARKLQTVYKMEPAGSRGVWALDDFQFIPFLWGSAQLIGHPHIRPSSFLKNEVVLGFYDHFMFLGCIKYINENKIGPFAEHSNQLWNISAVPTWDKVNSGLIKMYKGEVLCKFPVVQHILFGSILPITPAPPSQSERVYTGLVRDGLQPINRTKPCMQPPPPPPPQPVQPVERTESQASSIGDDALAEKFQNVPDSPDQPENTQSNSSGNM